MKRIEKENKLESSDHYNNFIQLIEDSESSIPYLDKLNFYYTNFDGTETVCWN